MDFDGIDIDDVKNADASILGGVFESEKAESMDNIIKVAKENMKREGHMRPQYVIQKKLGENRYKMSSLVLIFKNEQTKHELLKQMRKIVDGEVAYMMMEAWISERKPGEMPFIRPKLDVKRKEIIMVSEFRKDMKPGKNVYLFIKRDKEDNVIGFDKKEVVSDKQISLWNPYLEFEGVSKRMDKSREEVDEKFFRKKAKELAKKFGPMIEKADTDKKRKAVLTKMFQELDRLKSEFDKNRFERVEED